MLEMSTHVIELNIHVKNCIIQSMKVFLLTTIDC